MWYLSFLTISSFDERSLGCGREVVFKIKHIFLRNLVKHMIFQRYFSNVVFFFHFRECDKKIAFPVFKMCTEKLSLYFQLYPGGHNLTIII